MSPNILQCTQQRIYQAPQQRIYQAPNSNSAEVEKLFSRSACAWRINYCLPALAIGDLSNDKKTIIEVCHSPYPQHTQLGPACLISDWEKPRDCWTSRDGGPYRAGRHQVGKNSTVWKVHVVVRRRVIKVCSDTVVKYKSGKPERRIIQQCVFRF